MQICAVDNASSHSKGIKRKLKIKSEQGKCEASPVISQPLAKLLCEGSAHGLSPGVEQLLTLSQGKDVPRHFTFADAIANGITMVPGNGYQAQSVESASQAADNIIQEEYEDDEFTAEVNDVQESTSSRVNDSTCSNSS